MTRDLGLWEGELHILGFGMDPADEAFEAVLAAQRDRRRERFERTVARLRELDLPIDDQLGRHRPRPATTPSAGRRSPGPSIAAGSRGERRGRVPAAARAGASPRTCHGPGSGRARRSTRSGRPAACRCWPTSARRPRASRSSASWSRPASAGSRSTTARSTWRPWRSVGDGRGRARPGRDRRHRLPRRHRHVRRGARRAVGPAGGRGGGPRCRLAGTAMTDRSTLTRALPMLELVPAHRPPRRGSRPHRATPAWPSTCPRRGRCRASTSGRSAAR